MKICLAGTGAMGLTHMKALRKLDGAEVVSVNSRTLERGQGLLPSGRSRLPPPISKNVSTGLQSTPPEGRDHKTVGIPMDMTAGLRSKKTGALASIAMSFNNKGPLGGFHR